MQAPVDEEEEMAIPKLFEDEPVSGSVLLDEVREEKLVALFMLIYTVFPLIEPPGVVFFDMSGGGFIVEW